MSIALALDPQVQSATITGGVTLTVALLGVCAEMLRRQKKALYEVKGHAEAACEQVQNSHGTNLRDDLDRVMDGLDQLLEGQRQHTKDITGLREEIRHERVERVYVEKRLDDHLHMHA